MYEAAAHQEKRDICRLVIADMHEKGVRFLTTAGAPGWFAVETHTSERILNKVVRAIKQVCNSRQHSERHSEGMKNSLVSATKRKKLMQVHDLKPRDVIVNGNYAGTQLEPAIFRHIIDLWQKFFVVADNNEQRKMCLQVADDMKFNGVRFVKEEKPGLFLLCLLYTSPSPRDLSTSRMPSSA